ncbi:amino acid ABC transporter substrate-binding protein [Stutzerimonas stutzeri]|uniref:Amino acid ABC transporter substrate-binding protein n=1 Tax=Stutzerimonas stutzeri TaxID=316 RepID=A0A2S4AKV6_STUST|nr:amino acid ABC transporter substrate-binding protein [Stutzerimonas stutzeri]
MHRILSILLIWLLSTAAPASTVQWRFATEDFPPFTYPADTPVNATAGVRAAGPFVEVVTAICARLQHQCTITLYPWQRAFRLAEQGQVDGIFTLAHSPQREQIFHISRMLVTSRYSVFAQADSSFVFNHPDDMTGRRVGVYGPSGTSYVLSERLKSVPDVRFHLTADNRRLLRMLQSGRFGAEGVAVINQDVAWHLIDDERLEDVREAGEMGPISYGIGLSRKTVSAAQFEAFEQALDAAIADGTVQAILRRHKLEAAY